MRGASGGKGGDSEPMYIYIDKLESLFNRGRSEDREDVLKILSQANEQKGHRCPSKRRRAGGGWGYLKE